jgi:hypothetical protein
VYASISGLPVGTPSPNPPSSAYSSPTDERDDSRLIAQSPPALPPRTHTVHDATAESTTHRSHPPTAHSGSRHSMVEVRGHPEPAAFSLHRPQSMYVAQPDSDQPQPGLGQPQPGLEQPQPGLGQTKPLASSLQHDV